MMVENFHTTREAAKLLGISLRTAQKWVEKGLLEGWKTVGGHRRITHKSVMQFLNDRRRDGERQKSYSLPLLIIDDELVMLKLYRKQLSKWSLDVTVYTASNGYEGLVMVGEMAPRLLVCDLLMPGVNGFQVSRSLCRLERYERMAIVVASGLSPQEIAANGGLPERVISMNKPINFVRLQEIAKTLCRSSSTEDSSVNVG